MNGERRQAARAWQRAAWGQDSHRAVRGLPATAGRAGARTFRSSFAVRRGFTLIELLVVMVVVALLLTLAVPRYFHSVNRAREAVLKQDLAVIRDAIDKYYADNGRYPQTLEELAVSKYLRGIPRDPITESAATWVMVPPADVGQGGVYDVKSGAEGVSLDGTAYRDW